MDMRIGNSQTVTMPGIAGIADQESVVNTVALSASTQPALADYGPTLLRLALGVVFVAHGLLKILVFTVPGTVAYFQSLGLPGVLAYAVIVAEVFGGLALLAGYKTRVVAAVLSAIAFGSILGHAGNGWLFTNTGGGWEYPLLLGVVTAALALAGPGALAVDRK
jgi:putative oxidoreductase